MSDIQFIEGLIVKAPKENAPDFVKASLSIKRLELIAWLKSQEGDWINADIKEGKSGKWYAAVNTYKAEGGKSEQRQERGSYGSQQNPAPPPPGSSFDDQDVPF